MKRNSPLFMLFFDCNFDKENFAFGKVCETSEVKNNHGNLRQITFPRNTSPSLFIFKHKNLPSSYSSAMLSAKNLRTDGFLKKTQFFILKSIKCHDGENYDFNAAYFINIFNGL